MNYITEEDKAMLLEVVQSEEFKGALKHGSTKLTQKIFTLKDEVLQLEDRINDKKRILDELDDAIARKELGEAYIKRNVMKSMKQLEEEHEVITEELQEIRMMTGAEEISFKNYWKNSKDLEEVKTYIAKGNTLEEAMDKTNITRDRKELILRGVPILEAGRELVISDTISHLI